MIVKRMSELRRSASECPQKAVKHGDAFGDWVFDATYKVLENRNTYSMYWVGLKQICYLDENGKAVCGEGFFNMLCHLSRKTFCGIDGAGDFARAVVSLMRDGFMQGPEHSTVSDFLQREKVHEVSLAKEFLTTWLSKGVAVSADELKSLAKLESWYKPEIFAAAATELPITEHCVDGCWKWSLPENVECMEEV